MVRDDDPFPDDELPMEEYEDERETIHKGVLCCDCGNECDTEWQDFGIGSYEYHGARGVDTQWVEVTPCCESTDWAETTEQLVAYWRGRFDSADQERLKANLRAEWRRRRVETFRSLARRYRGERDELAETLKLFDLED